ncbi:SHOCT domain-containing protein [Patescibacteria group bacterium]|nr:SHOCT domain-containing protein [Patescibacteria group bacterium]MCL5797337.1 SHOCT domain-containing protein [Patescibacteria group bacterium]
MKKLLFGLSTLLILGIVFSSSVSAQGMMNWGNTSSATPSSVTSTAQDESKGRQLWDQLQAKQVTCESLKDDDFEVLGEYFMGQSVGNTERHAVMNQMMQNMMGQNGEEQMHISLGKRSSSCDTNVSFPSGYGLPMMWWMMGGGGNPMMGYGGWNNWGNMMGWGGFGFGWIFMIIFWTLIILGVVALVRYLGGTRQNNTIDRANPPLDILKERYAKGEINKKEFEEMKKDLR